MRIAAVVAVFVILFAASLVGVVAPASGQTIPPIPTYVYATPVTSYTTATPRPGCEEWCAPMPTPPTSDPGFPLPVPTSEVDAAFPGMPSYIAYLVYCPKVGRD